MKIKLPILSLFFLLMISAINANKSDVIKSIEKKEESYTKDYYERIEFIFLTEESNNDYWRSQENWQRNYP